MTLLYQGPRSWDVQGCLHQRKQKHACQPMREAHLHCWLWLGLHLSLGEEEVAQLLVDLGQIHVLVVLCSHTQTGGLHSQLLLP